MEDLPGGSAVKDPPANAGEVGSIPGLGRAPGERSSNPLQYSCLENSTDRGAWQAGVHEVGKSWTRLSNWTAATEERGLATPSGRNIPTDQFILNCLTLDCLCWQP